MLVEGDGGSWRGCAPRKSKAQPPLQLPPAPSCSWAHLPHSVWLSPASPACWSLGPTVSALTPRPSLPESAHWHRSRESKTRIEEVTPLVSLRCRARRFPRGVRGKGHPVSKHTEHRTSSVFPFCSVLFTHVTWFSGTILLYETWCFKFWNSIFWNVFTLNKVLPLFLILQLGSFSGGQWLRCHAPRQGT